MREGLGGRKEERERSCVCGIAVGRGRENRFKGRKEERERRCVGMG